MKRITKTTFENTNPVITVNAEFAKLSVEYFVDTYATTRLTIKPTVPESSRFLLRDNGAAIPFVKFVKEICYHYEIFLSLCSLYGKQSFMSIHIKYPNLKQQIHRQKKEKP